MKNSKIITIFICLSLSTLIYNTATATQLNINKNNELIQNLLLDPLEYSYFVDDNADSSWYDNIHLKKIQDAIDNSSHHDNIYVYSGSYYENIIVHKKVNITGEDKNTTIIDGLEKSNVISILFDGVLISGFTIQNSSKKLLDAFDNAGISVISQKSKITNNIIRNNLYAISIRDSNENIIDNNIICDNKVKKILTFGTAITISNSHNNIISNNNIFNNPIGISIDQSIDNLICNNSVNKSNLAITISSNIVSGRVSKNNTVMGNKISGNNLGISIDESNKNIIKLNTIKGNINGVQLTYATENSILQNNIKLNLKQARFVIENLSHLENTWNGNYWNMPRIMPKAIIGYKILDIPTIPYNIKFPLFNFDKNPAREPYDI